MSPMRYKIFNGRTGEPLAYSTDIAQAVEARDFYQRTLSVSGEHVAAILDTDTDTIL